MAKQKEQEKKTTTKMKKKRGQKKNTILENSFRKTSPWRLGGETAIPLRWTTLKKG